MTESNEETRTALEGLAAKLAELDLNEGEAAALATIIERAGAAGAKSDPEVSGFGLVTDDGTLVMFKNSDGILHTRLAQGIGIDPGKVWTDMRPLN